MAEEQKSDTPTTPATNENGTNSSEQAQTISRVMELIDDGTMVNYSTAPPGSVSWQDYQLQRMLAIQKLKMKSLAHQQNTDKMLRILMGDVVEDPHLPDLPEFHEGPPTILKKVAKRDSPTAQYREGSISWKEPIADTRIMLMPMPMLKVPDNNNGLRTTERIKAKPGSSSTKTNNKGEKGRLKNRAITTVSKPTFKANQLRAKSPGHGKPQRKLPKRNNEKTNVDKPINPSRIAGFAYLRSIPLTPTPTPKITTLNASRVTATQTYLLPSSKSLSGQTNKVALKASTKATLPTSVKLKLDNSLGKQSFHDKPALSQAMSEDINNNQSTSIPRNENTKGKADAEKLKGDVQNCEPTSKKNIQKNTLPSSRKEALGNNPTVLNGKAGKVATLLPLTISSKGLATQTEDSNNKNPSPKGFTNDSYNEKVKVGNETSAFRKKDSITTTTQLIAPTTNVNKNKSKRRLIDNSDAETDDGSRKPDIVKVTRFQPKSKKRNAILKQKVLEGLRTTRKPPVLPELEVCNVLPGTPGWDQYWTDFNKKVSDYYTSLEQYSRQMDDLLLDAEDAILYKQELQRRQLDETAMRVSMGIAAPKPPLIRQPLKDTIDIGGYIIRVLGGDVAGVFITTYDHSSFRLEIQVEKLDSELDSISIDTKSNTMTINIPSSNQKGQVFRKLIQISVPTYKKVQNLEIGNPLYNGGKMIVTGK